MLLPSVIYLSKKSVSKKTNFLPLLIRVEFLVLEDKKIKVRNYKTKERRKINREYLLPTDRYIIK
jgi:hypothetical protein